LYTKMNSFNQRVFDRRLCNIESTFILIIVHGDDKGADLLSEGLLLPLSHPLDGYDHLSLSSRLLAMTSYVFLHSLVVRELSRADVASEDEVVLGHSCTNPRPATFFQVSLQLGLSQEPPATSLFTSESLLGVDVKVLLQSTQMGEGRGTMSTSEPFLARVPQPVRLHIFLACEPLWAAITFIRPHARVSHHVAFQVPGARKFPTTYVTVQLSWLLMEFTVFL